MAHPKLTTTQMAAELGISPLTSIVLTNEPTSAKAKQGDGQEDSRTQQTMQAFLRSINMLSPKDGRPTVKFKSSPKRIERHLTPEKCKGRELGIVLELQTERDVDRLISTWKKASKKGERRQMIKWPVEKEPTTGVADVEELEQDDAEVEPQTKTEIRDSSSG